MNYTDNDNQFHLTDLCEKIFEQERLNYSTNEGKNQRTHMVDIIKKLIEDEVDKNDN